MQRLVQDRLWELAEPLIPHQWVLDELGAGDATAPACGRKGGCADRGEPGRSGQAWLEAPSSVRADQPAAGGGVSVASTHDSQAVQPLVRAIPAVRSRRSPRRRQPAKLHADTGYD